MSDKFVPEKRKLSEDTATKLLANVFVACEQEQNSTPLKLLESYSEYRMEKYSLQKILAVIAIVIFALLPACFVTPRFNIDVTSEEDAKIPTYEVTVDGQFPVSSVTASVGTVSVPVYETGDRTYVIEPRLNGKMKVRVELLNKQYAVREVTVDSVDLDAPQFVKSEKVGEYAIRFYVDDGEGGSGIDYKNCYAETTVGGKRLRPISWNEKTGSILFTYPTENVNVFIPDKKGNTLQFVMTVK